MNQLIRTTIIALLLLCGLVFFGNDVLIVFESDLPSKSRGSPANGSLTHGKRLPSSGPNFVTYSRLGSLIGRTAVHDRVRAALLDSFARLETGLPETTFVVGETGWPGGGSFRPHRTHQNGLSVDIMVPVRRSSGKPAVLPTHVFNKLGYAVEFGADGRNERFQIDFDAIAAHLESLDLAARDNGLGIEVVIFDPKLQEHLFATGRGRMLKSRLRFSQRPAWVRHDEHYHVNFAVRSSERRLK